MVPFLVCVVVVAVVWVILVLPRAREWIDRCNDDMNSPLRAWAPPANASSLGVEQPPLEGVDWKALSNEVDAEGVHVIDYDVLSQRGVAGKRRNPANIAVFAVKHANAYWETRDKSDLLLATRQFQYFVDNAAPVTIDGRLGVVWCADFDLGYQYGVKAPWRSAYFQIFSMNALLWGYAVTGKAVFRDLAEKGLVPLGHSVEEGGLCHRTPNGGLFFEEVVSSPLHHILNGHLHVLTNLYDFRSFTGIEDADAIIAQGVRGTVDMLPHYDRYGYSLYSLAPNPGFKNHFNIANPYYHRMHVALLRKLHSLTQDIMFERYAERWEAKCGGVFDTAWAMLLIGFRDVMRISKSVRK